MRKKQETKKRIKTELCPWQYEALETKITHFAMISGISTGKTFTGAHFVIKMCFENPTKTGFIGANTYDQLSQATLRELMYWFDVYRIQYVIDCMPPKEWGVARKFKTYKNIITVRVPGNRVVHIFTRVLQDGDKLRGIQFSWYWLDETRDTPQNTHDIILSRMRESKRIRGLVTTTPVGEDWSWKRFVKNADGKLFGSAHVPTIRSVEYGIITQEFYDALLHAYSANMAAQELDARHVNCTEGRCYYSATERNGVRDSAWEPNPDYPLVVGMDFNFSPAPMVWEIGQMDEDGESIHWFDELSGVEVSSPEMARRLGRKYGTFFLRIFGDASGTRGTTSNAGKTDFDQIAEELSELNVLYSIDTDQANPRVRDRVENVNRLLCDADARVSMTYDVDHCPLLAADMERVVWRHGKTSGDGDETLTHASDGAGYALMKVLPPLAGHGGTIRTVANQLGALGGR